MLERKNIDNLKGRKSPSEFSKPLCFPLKYASSEYYILERMIEIKKTTSEEYWSRSAFSSYECLRSEWIPERSWSKVYEYLSTMLIEWMHWINWVSPSKANDRNPLGLLLRAAAHKYSMTPSLIMKLRQLKSSSSFSYFSSIIVLFRLYSLWSILIF